MLFTKITFVSFPPEKPNYVREISCPSSTLTVVIRETEGQSMDLLEVC